MPEPRPEPRRLPREERRTPLDMLVDVPGILGSVLLSRDGLPVVSEYAPLRRGETFVAMAAAAMAAAEVMAGELHLEGGVLLRMDHPSLTIAALAVSPELVVVVFAQPGTRVEQAFERLRAAAAGGVE